MTAPKIRIEEEIHGIDVYPGETLTVWLNAYPREDEARSAEQVELRVLPTMHGKREVFVGTKVGSAQVYMGFEDWEPMPAKGGAE